MQALLRHQQHCRPTGQQSTAARQQQRSAGQRCSRCSSTLREQQQTYAFLPQQQLNIPTEQLQSLQMQSQQSSSSVGSSADRRGMLSMLGAAAAAVLLSSMSVDPAAAAAAVNSSSALEEYMKLEDAGKLRDQRSLENIRGKYNIKRGIDGRVQLRRKSNGNWMSVRLDMEVPGAILLRDMKTEAIFALETDGLPQVDLSDDYVLFMMFADGQWENDMTPIEFEEDGGQTKQLTMTEKEFHEFVGLLKEPDEPETPLKRK